MELSSLFSAVGVDSCPAEMETCLSNPGNLSGTACNLENIRQLQADWDILGPFYETVKNVAEDINRDPNRSIWIKAALAYANGRTRKQICQIPIPRPDGSQVTGMLPLYIILGLLPTGIASYRRRGFSEAEIRVLMYQIQESLRVTQRSEGFPSIDRTHFSWLLLYAQGNIFEVNGLQFELKKLPEAAVYLQNRQSGQVIPLICKGMIHHSGWQILGSAGFEDPEGAVNAEFREDAENFWGYPCVDNRISTELTRFSKMEWNVFLRPGQDAVGFHISEGADISPAVVDQCLARAADILRQRYPEYESKAVYCSSWILDPMLQTITGPNSKISRLIDRFVKYPVKSDGNEIFHYVFDSRPEDLSKLPEDTSLRRGLKQQYLQGQYNHSYAGIMIP